VQTLIFGVLFGTISSVQPIFDVAYGRAEAFPYYFALMAVAAAPAAPINGRLVMRFGMRPLVRRALAAFAVGSAVLALAVGTSTLGPAEFWLFAAWGASVFALAGFAIGNLNALALEPLGYIAGMAASIMGALATIGGAAIGAGIGQLFDGTALPLALSALVVSTLAAAVMRSMPREAVDP